MSATTTDRAYRLAQWYERFAATHPGTDPDDSDEFHEQARRIMGIAPPPTVVKASKVEVAGLAIRARGTGRVLVLQRALPQPGDEEDPAAGSWEFPGGHLEPTDDDPLEGAKREWSEETGIAVPEGKVTGHWVSKDGVY